MDGLWGTVIHSIIVITRYKYFPPQLIMLMVQFAIKFDCKSFRSVERRVLGKMEKKTKRGTELEHWHGSD